MGNNVYARDATANTNTCGWPAGGVAVPNGGTPLVLTSRQAVYLGGGGGNLYKLRLADGLTSTLNLGIAAVVSDATYDVQRDAFYVTGNRYLFAVDGNW